jgi:hypothetical protein
MTTPVKDLPDKWRKELKEYFDVGTRQIFECHADELEAALAAQDDELLDSLIIYCGADCGEIKTVDGEGLCPTCGADPVVHFYEVLPLINQTAPPNDELERLRGFVEDVKAEVSILDLPPPSWLQNILQKHKLDGGE